MTRNFRVRKNGAMPIQVSLPFRAAIPERTRGHDRIEPSERLSGSCARSL
jgi:hypothetical protein